MGRLGAKACNDAKLAERVRKVLPGGSYQLAVGDTVNEDGPLRLKFNVLNMDVLLCKGFTAANRHPNIHNA